MAMSIHDQDQRVDLRAPASFEEPWCHDFSPDELSALGLHLPASTVAWPFGDEDAAIGEEVTVIEVRASRRRADGSTSSSRSIRAVATTDGRITWSSPRVPL